MDHTRDENGVVTVVLSRANLITLLNKLDRGDSKCTLRRRCEDGHVLYVRAESDEQHYATRARGRVDDREEAAIVAYRLVGM